MSSDPLPLFENSGVKVPEPTDNADPLNESLNKEINKDLPVRTGWVPSSESVTVAGREIGGMVYIGKHIIRNKNRIIGKSGAYIDPTLPVADGRVGQVDRWGYIWPKYHSISPERRAAYLDWLATGRSDASFDPSHLRMYLYGLERRFAVDDPPEAEKREILDEALRLAGLSHDDTQVWRDLEKFILLARLTLEEFSQLEPVYEYYNWELPFPLRAAIGAHIVRRERLPAEWFFSWFYCHPESRLKLAAKRCPDEFRELFKLRFDERFPKGYKVNRTKHVLHYHYFAASADFRIDLDVKLNGKFLSDVSPQRKFLIYAEEIAAGVSKDLGKLSRYVGNNPNDSDILGARAYLPKELWQIIPCEKLDPFRKWARRVASKNGQVRVEQLIAKIEGYRPGKIAKQQLTSASAILAQTGFGFAPDPKYAFQSPKVGEPVVIFDTGEAVANLDDASDTYRASLLTSALGAFVAHADGKVTESEREALREKVISIEFINKEERRRLIADLEWMLSVAPNFASLSRKLKEFGPGVIPAARNAVVAAAHADGVVQPQEVKAIERIYKALGLSVSLVYSDLHASDMHDGIAIVRSAESAASGESIPVEMPTGEIQLDSERIATIHSDTERVSSVLGEIFSEAKDSPQNKGAQEVVVPGLDARHAAFVKEVIAEKHWAEGSFKELCDKHSFMPSGVIEDINEWAFESYGDALLDENDGYEVNAEIADALQREFEGKNDDARVETG